MRRPSLVGDNIELTSTARRGVAPIPDVKKFVSSVASPPENESESPPNNSAC